MRTLTRPPVYYPLFSVIRDNDRVVVENELVCQDGCRVFQGTNHGKEYRDNEKDMHMIFVDYFAL